MFCANLIRLASTQPLNPAHTLFLALSRCPVWGCCCSCCGHCAPRVAKGFKCTSCLAPVDANVLPPNADHHRPVPRPGSFQEHAGRHLGCAGLRQHDQGPRAVHPGLSHRCAIDDRSPSRGLARCTLSASANSASRGVLRRSGLLQSNALLRPPSRSNKSRWRARAVVQLPAPCRHDPLTAAPNEVSASQVDILQYRRY